MKTTIMTLFKVLKGLCTFSGFIALAVVGLTAKVVGPRRMYDEVSDLSRDLVNNRV
jgi:hypothetical protein